MIAISLLIGSVGLLIAIRMTRARYKPAPRISAARFFEKLDPPRNRPPVIRWGRPTFSRAFFLQLLILLVLVIAALSVEPLFTLGSSKSVGVWIIVDTSASMSTLQDGKTRLQLAQEQATEAIVRAQNAAEGLSNCWQVSAFDLERRGLLVTRDADTARREVEALKPRLLGTDLNLVRSALVLLQDQSGAPCEITHIVVLSDQPAPEWLGEKGMLPVIWRDVAAVVDNTGFTRLEAMRHPLTGMVGHIEIEISAFGAAPQNVQLQIQLPDGTTLQRQSNWRSDNVWVDKLSPTQPGLYFLRLSPGGVYKFDDDVAVEITEAQSIRVDWGAPDRSLLDLLKATGAWVEDKRNPQLRVVTRLVEGDAVPTLIVGSGYTGSPRAGRQISDFYEPSSLLSDLNLDVVESAGTGGIELPPGFEPVLRWTDGNVWLAQRTVPPAAYVPGLPTGKDDNLGRLSMTVFFNAVRWLMQTRPLPELYTLTTPALPLPQGNRIAMHEGEGNTTLKPISRGSFDDIQPGGNRAAKQPAWPPLVALALMFLMLERVLSVMGGTQWR